jgi:hypothetical protein
MRRLTLVALVTLTAAFFCSPRAAVTAAPDVTFTRDVAPILHAKCVTCHRAGEVAPMALLTYQDARPWARAIKDKVLSRQMPPWFADPAVGSFANDPSLTAGEIATIAKWVEGGAPQGDLKDMPKAPQFVDGWQLGEPDLIVELPEIQIPATGGDYFPTPNLTLPLTEDRWIRAVEIRPSAREVTHHSVIFSANVAAAMAVPSSAINPSGVFDVLAVWAVGTAPTVYPDGTGRWVRKGQTLRTNLHYHPNGKAQIDRTRVGLYFGKGELKKEVAASLAGNINFAIPPQAPHYEMRAAYVADQDINIVSFFPHMHLRGTDMSMTATYPGGRRETLLNVPSYDFNWQLFYYPKTTVRLPQGTRVDLVAHYDNSSANKHNPDPTRSVGFGEASTAEMMFGMFEFTAVDGVSPKPSTPSNRIQILRSSFADSAYLVDLVLPNQTIPSVLHIPRAGEGGWYVPTFGMITVAPVTNLQWTGGDYRFTAVLRVGMGAAPFTVTGSVQDDGSIRASVEPIGTGRIPFKEFTGSLK